MISGSGNAFLKGTVDIDSAPWDGSLELTIMGQSKPIVSESKPGTIFPVRCPERHIETGGNFCVGLGQPAVNDEETADRWWETLRHHIMCQRMAHRTGVWPDAFALDHGDAGTWHEKALKLAKELDIEEEYAAAHADELSWITDKKIKLVHKDGRPINGKAPCHLGCTWRKRGRMVARLRVDCDRREQLLELIEIEKTRREKLAEYWLAVRRVGTKCCETMRDCELKGGANE